MDFIAACCWSYLWCPFQPSWQQLGAKMTSPYHCASYIFPSSIDDSISQLAHLPFKKTCQTSNLHQCSSRIQSWRQIASIHQKFPSHSRMRDSVSVWVRILIIRSNFGDKNFGIPENRLMGQTAENLQHRKHSRTHPACRGCRSTDSSA